MTSSDVTSNETWTIENGLGKAQVDEFEICVSPSQPSTSVRIGSNDAERWNVFGVQAVPKHQLLAEEIYARQSDLIARFDQSEADRFAFQVDYRLLPPQANTKLGIELWASVQTDDLDSEPVLTIDASTPSGEYWEILNHKHLLDDGAASANSDNSTDNSAEGPAALIARTSNATGVWLIEPTDQRNAALLSSPGESQQRLELFGHFMEKGVIRRARMRFHLCEAELSVEHIRALYEDLAASPLPLTA